MSSPQDKVRLSAATSLSGVAQSPEVTKHTSVPAGPRLCAVCSVHDREALIDGETDANGNTKIEHLVTIELQYIKDRTKVTAYHLVRGWRYKYHQGRHAMERFICRPCLRDAETMRRDWMRKCANDSGTRKTNHDAFYGDLCG